MHFFVQSTFFDTSTTCKNNISAPLHTICDFKMHPQKHYKTRGKQAKQILDQFLTQPWTNFWLKKGLILDQFWLYSIYYKFIITSAWSAWVARSLWTHLSVTFIPTAATWQTQQKSWEECLCTEMLLDQYRLERISWRALSELWPIHFPVKVSRIGMDKCIGP